MQSRMQKCVLIDLYSLGVCPSRSMPYTRCAVPAKIADFSASLRPILLAVFLKQFQSER